MRGFVALACCVLAGCATNLSPRTLIGPYQDVSLGLEAGGLVFDSPAWLGAPGPGRVLLWAFATGECGAERWGEIDTEAFARANVAAFERAGRDFIISTGGEAGIFSCASDAGMARFVERYRSARLIGLDFDIEGRQTPAQIGSLVQRAAFAKARWPALRVSFTLATHAASDGTLRGLNATGETVLAALRDSTLNDAVINLMVMNYGQADSRWCVVTAGRCDMGRSAVQAAHNLHRKYGVPYARIAITAMLGENDVAGNVVSLADAALLAEGARTLGLAGVHHWSIDRDQPCPAGSARVSPRCHGLPGVAPGRFGAALTAP